MGEENRYFSRYTRPLSYVKRNDNFSDPFYMFINDDNNRDNYNYPIGERDYLSECETPNIRKYYKLLVHTVKLGYIRTKCITW